MMAWRAEATAMKTGTHLRRTTRGEKQAGDVLDSAEQDRRREDVMRPWPTLGYDRDRIALHMMHVEAFPTAESEFRRAVWLNPYEPRFKVHLAWCLFREKKYAEAKEWVLSALEQRPGDKECTDVLRVIEDALEAERRL